ncbi:MAG TPA: alpha-ketoglutarate-dependent dioxygenase AlkB [Allosphingosinicella sp.]|nr:alpha-ketoglutarate-dependent dioxygenase AlkB [Allosphingosinicella sp.]
MPKPQLSLFEKAPEAGPAGLAYAPSFLDPDEESALAAHIADLPFKPFEFHGFTGNRRTVSFGLHYAFDGSGLREAEPIPDWLQPLRARAAELAGREPEDFVHALVIEYAAGAGIGWHRDRPVFGDVVGISLLAPAPLRFRRRIGAKWERFTLTAEPRSAYLLSGESRHEWEHSIPPLETLRYSVTLRTLAASPSEMGRGTTRRVVEG